MAEATRDEFSAGFSDDDLALVERWREIAGAFDDGHEQIHRTEIRFVRDRHYASAFVKSHRLEIAVDLLRQAPHPLLLKAFRTTRRVITHRLTIERLEQLDASIEELVAEAYETVGPGTR